MRLTRKQKRFVETLLKKHSIAEIAELTNIPEQTIADHIRHRVREDEYKKIFKAARLRQSEESAVSPSSFNLIRFIKSNWMVLVLIVVLINMIYANSLQNDFISDDKPGIMENRQIGSFSHAVSSPPFLIGPLSRYVAFKIGGLSPAPFRVMNMTFHVFNTMLFFIILSVMTRRPVAVIAAFIFAVHPILTESITWISGGGYSLYSVFVLGALLMYILYFAKKRKRYFLGSIVLFITALFTTEKAAMFPLLPTLFVAAYDKAKSWWKSLVLLYGIAGVFTVSILSGLFSRAEMLQSEYYQNTGLVNPFTMIPFTIVSYLKLVLFPIGLTFYHSEYTLTGPEFLLYAMVFFAFIGFVFLMYKMNRFLFFWSAFFIAAISPILVPVNISSFVAERYVYLGSAGVMVLVAWLIDKFASVFSSYKTIAMYILTIAVVVVLSFLTIQRNSEWKNEAVLATASARYSPSSHINHNNLGITHLRNRQYDKAIEEFKKAIELLPTYANGYLNMGKAYQEKGDVDNAIRYYKQALEMNPNLWEAHFGLAFLSFEQGKLEDSRDALEKAIALKKDEPQILNNLAVVYIKLGEIEKAKELLKRSLAIAPENENVQKLLDELDSLD